MDALNDNYKVANFYKIDSITKDNLSAISILELEKLEYKLKK